jgi:hypothetical protein
LNVEFTRAVNAAGDGVTLGNGAVFGDCVSLVTVFVPNTASVAGYKAKAAWDSPSDIQTRIVTRAENIYIVTFDLNGGHIAGNTAHAVRMTPPGGGVVAWPEPGRSGRVLKGWNVGGFDVYFSSTGNWQEIAFLSDITITAIW